ncbi:MAG: single-stranded-DNA-specific exonuclease RecJ [Thermodesulfobacteriota bacterium]
MKRWQILRADADAVANLRRLLNCTFITATLLVNRNLVKETEVRRFLNTSLTQLRSPLEMAGMGSALERIVTAVELGQKILIFGDYDVDGITATATLLEFFQYLKADVSYYIPHRIREGYSLQPAHIREYAVPSGIDLIITADCGSGSHQAVAAAAAAGIDVIITDHHQIFDRLPPAVSVINPHRPDCAAGFENLAGVGVALCLLIGLRKRLRDINFWQDLPEPNLKDFCDLVAVGTVADIVPLQGENRIFTAAGIEMIQSAGRPGLKALLLESGTDPKTVDTQDIAFRLAPRLNAAGRLDHAAAAVELLTTRSPETAGRIAVKLNALNRQRQGVEQAMLADISAMLADRPDLLGNRSLVLAHSGWHEGVLGIVASRLLEMYFRPVVLISVKDGIARGSARSIPGFDMFKGLTACRAFLKNFGGHTQAAGLSLAVEMIEPFRRHFEKTVLEATLPDDFSPTLTIDCKLDFKDINAALLDELSSLEPYGSGNPEPLFTAENITVVSASIVGKYHRRMLLGQPGADTCSSFNAIQFNIDPSGPAPQRLERIAFRLRWNHWNGKKTLQLIIEEAIAG